MKNRIEYKFGGFCEICGFDNKKCYICRENVADIFLIIKREGDSGEHVLKTCSICGASLIRSKQFAAFIRPYYVVLICLYCGEIIDIDIQKMMFSDFLDHVREIQEQHAGECWV